MHVLSFLIAILAFAAPAGAVSNLILSPGSGSTYVLSGQGVEGAAAIECAVTYDAALLGNPRVELGTLAAGGMMAVNPNMPGTVRIAIIRTSPMNGSGPIATISFDRKGESSGIVNVLSAKMLTLDGKQLALSVQVIGQPETSVPSTASVPVQDSGARQGAVSGAGASVTQAQTGWIPPIGAAVIPQKQESERQRTDEAAGRREQATVPDRTAPAAEPVRTAKREESAAPSSSRQIYSQASVLERFKDFRGKPSMSAYLALFDQEGMIGFRQDPPVALADGKSRVSVTFISSSPTRTNSDIAVMGARLLSLRKDPDASNTFIIELLPAKGELQPSVSVPQDAVLMVFPLTVAPKVDTDLLKAGKTDEGSFKAFLEDRGAPGKPKYDLNGDGRRDYMDDYLFTANYIAARERAKGSAARQ